MGSVLDKKNRDWSRWERNGAERKEGHCEWKQGWSNTFLCTIQGFTDLIQLTDSYVVFKDTGVD